MYTSVTIKQLHHALQALDPSALVLLGGSYLYDEAVEESDVDFYFIIPSWKIFFLKKFKKIIQNLKQRFSGVNFSVMIVPQWLRRHGYYIYGKDVSGKIHTWELPISILIRNCLKLAYFNYLRSMVEPKNKERNVQKVKKQLAVAELAAQGKVDFKEPIFSWKYIKRHLVSSVISTVATKGSEVEKSLDCSDSQIKGFLDCGFAFARNDNANDGLRQVHGQFLPYFNFSLSNYLLYNIRFLLKGNPLFLFSNPDKMVLEKMVIGIEHEEKLPELYKEIKRIVFPVIIF